MIGIRGLLLTGCSGKLLEKKDNILIDDSLHLEYPRPYTGFPVCFSSEVATDLAFTDKTRFQFGLSSTFFPSHSSFSSHAKILVEKMDPVLLSVSVVGSNIPC